MQPIILPDAAHALFCSGQLSRFSKIMSYATNLEYKSNKNVVFLSCPINNQQEFRISTSLRASDANKPSKQFLLIHV